MLQALLMGVSLGLFAAVQPGVLQAFLLGETMRWGVAATLPLVIAPLVSDGPIALITLLVLAQTPPWLLASIELLGGAFVIWLAFDAARTLRGNARTAGGAASGSTAATAADGPIFSGGASATTPERIVARSATAERILAERTTAVGRAAADEDAASPRGRFVRAVLVNGLNPGPWLFWAIVLGPIAVDAWRAGPMLAVTTVGAFYATLLGGFIGLIALFGLASRRGARVRAALQGVSALALGAFGLLLLWHGASKIV